MKHFFLTLALSFVVAVSDAATRVALVSDSGDAQVANVLDMATATLGQEKGIELLDRTAIARVLAEQNLSLSGAVNPNSVVSVGKLLSVDLFAVVDSVTQTNEVTGKAVKSVAGLVVFDAKTGVRLLDATLSADGDEKLAEFIAAGVLTAQQKQTAVGLPTICLMSVRNADLPRSLDSWCDSVGLLLERRLTASLGCVVLERERLDQVNKERSLPTGAEQQQQLLASLVMMELECGRGPEGKGMLANARLTDNSGKLLDAFSVTNQSANADELAVALYQKISEAMKFKSGQADEDRVKESDRFRQEADFFLSHRDWEHGIQDLEAALALNPENISLRKELGGTLIGYTGVQTNFLQALRIGDRASDLFLECARESCQKLNPDSPKDANHLCYESGVGEYDEWATYVWKLTPSGVSRGTFQSAARNLSAAEKEEARQVLRSIYEKYSSFRVDNVLPALAQALSRHPDGWMLFHDYGVMMSVGMMRAENMAALYPEDWSQNWLANLKGYLDMLGQLPLQTELKQNAENEDNLNKLLFSPPTWAKVRPDEREAAWRLMARHPSPLIRALGKLSQLEASHEEAGKQQESLPPVDQVYRLYLQEGLNDPVQNTNLIESRLFYGAARHIGGSEIVDFCDFMLQRNDLNPDIISQATSYLMSQTNRESAAKAIKIYDRAVALLKQPAVRYFGGDANQYLQDLAKQRTIAQNEIEGSTETSASLASPSPSPLPSLPPLRPAWREVHQLIDLAGAKNGLTQMLGPVIQDDYVYATGFGTDADGQFLQLLRIPLKEEAFETLSRIAVTNMVVVPRMTRVACVDKDNYYLGTKDGILIFPKSGEPVEALNQNNGLPSDNVTALDSLDGKLYIGLGESGYLVSYDLKQRQIEVLCSARRREQLSPFDNGSPLKIPIIVADEAKHRIIYLTDQAGNNENWDQELRNAQRTKTDVYPLIYANARAGMWSYYPATREFKCILPRHPNAAANDLTWIGRVSDTQIMLACRWDKAGAALFDFAADKTTLLYGKCYAAGLEDYVEGWLRLSGTPVNPALQYRPLFQHAEYLNSPSIIVGNWVWNAGSYMRMSMETGQTDNLPPLRSGDTSFNPGECFRRVGSNQALIGDQRGLWLVTFADDDAKTKDAQP